MAWVDDEPALLVSCCLTPRGWAELTKAGRGRQSGVPRYHADQQEEPGYTSRTTKLLLLPGSFVLWFACYFPLEFFPLVLCLPLFTSKYY